MPIRKRIDAVFSGASPSKDLDTFKERLCSTIEGLEEGFPKYAADLATIEDLMIPIAEAVCHLFRSRDGIPVPPEAPKPEIPVAQAEPAPTEETTESTPPQEPAAPQESPAAVTDPAPVAEEQPPIEQTAPEAPAVEPAAEQSNDQPATEQPVEEPAAEQASDPAAEQPAEQTAAPTTSKKKLKIS